LELTLRSKSGQAVICRYSGEIIQTAQGKKLFSTAEDISARKQAEAALRASEARFKSLVETQSDLIARSDLDGRLTFVNDAYCKTFGKTREELLGKLFTPTVSSEDLPTVTAMIKAVQSSPHHVQTETRHPTPSGIRWFSWDNVAVLDESGKVQELQGIGRDITDRKQAEEALQTEKANLDAIFESSPVAMFILDETTNIVQLNAAAVAMTGGSDSEALQHRPGNALRCIHSSKDPRGCGYSKECRVCNVRNGIESLIAQGGTIHAAELVLELIRNGTPQNIWMSVGAEPILLNGRRHVCVAMDDITERKQADDTARKTQMLLTEAQRIAHMGSWQMDVASNYVTWSDELYRITGWNLELPPPDYTEHPKLFTPESWKLLNTVLPQTVETGIPYEVELEMVKPDGSHGWMLARGEAVRDARNVIVTLRGVALDITERKQAEAALRESEQQHRTILETAMNGFWLTDIQGNLLEVNETYCRMSGYTEQELLSMRIPDLESKETVNDTASHIQKIIEQGEDRFESRHRRKDGSFFEIEASVQYRAEEGGRFVAFIQDITARKQTEDEIKKQLAELQRWNNATLDREMRILEIKREVNELLGKAGQPPRYPSAES
jgi:PAS domain S-box-containing protein